MQNEFKYFELDKYRLDEEWVSQVALYHGHATKLAEAREEFERAKAARDVVYAELDRDIRANPGAFGLGEDDRRVTESAIRNAALLQKRYTRAENRVINAKHDVDIHAVAVETLDHRKKALENLVQLQLANYFAEPKAPKNAREYVGAMERQAAFGNDGKKKKKKVHY